MQVLPVDNVFLVAWSLPWLFVYRLFFDANGNKQFLCRLKIPASYQENRPSPHGLRFLRSLLYQCWLADNKTNSRNMRIIIGEQQWSGRFLVGCGAKRFWLVRLCPSHVSDFVGNETLILVAQLFSFQYRVTEGLGKSLLTIDWSFLSAC